MKVYVLLKGYAHGGSEILGVYSSFDLAHSYGEKVAIKRGLKENEAAEVWNGKYGDIWLEINEWEVTGE